MSGKQTNKDRQARLRAKMEAGGLVQCNVWVPADAVADLRMMAELLRAHPHLLPGTLRDPASGKLVGLKAGYARLEAARRAAAAGIAEVAA